MLCLDHAVNSICTVKHAVQSCRSDLTECKSELPSEAGGLVVEFITCCVCMPVLHEYAQRSLDLLMAHPRRFSHYLQQQGLCQPEHWASNDKKPAVQQ